MTDLLITLNFSKDSIYNKHLALQYLEASSAYINKETENIIFNFPKLSDNWVWNGYYFRKLNSSYLNYFGNIAIRVAYDKVNKVHHAFIPAFVIPYLKITTFDLENLIKLFLVTFSAANTLDKFSHDKPEYFDMPLSSFYWLLSWFTSKCRSELGECSDSNSIIHLYNKTASIVDKYLENLHSRASP